MGEGTSGRISFLLVQLKVLQWRVQCPPSEDSNKYTTCKKVESYCGHAIAENQERRWIISNILLHSPNRTRGVDATTFKNLGKQLHRYSINNGITKWHTDASSKFYGGGDNSKSSPLSEFLSGALLSRDVGLVPSWKLQITNAISSSRNGSYFCDYLFLLVLKNFEPFCQRYAASSYQLNTPCLKIEQTTPTYKTSLTRTYICLLLYVTE